MGKICDWYVILSVCQLTPYSNCRYLIQVSVKSFEVGNNVNITFMFCNIYILNNHLICNTSTSSSLYCENKPRSETNLPV